MGGFWEDFIKDYALLGRSERSSRGAGMGAAVPGAGPRGAVGVPESIIMSGMMPVLSLRIARGLGRVWGPPDTIADFF